MLFKARVQLFLLRLSVVLCDKKASFPLLGLRRFKSCLAISKYYFENVESCFEVLKIFFLVKVKVSSFTFVRKEHLQRTDLRENRITLV